MQLASRSYLAAGVALVGAGAIAVSPLAPPAPDVHLPAIDGSSAAVNLTAAANPLQLWADVIGAAFENVGGLGAQLAADPAPILRQIIANQLHSAKVLGTATQGLVEGMQAALDPENFMSFQAAVKGAFDLIAAGDLQNGFAALATSPLMLGLPLLSFVGNQWVPGAWSVIAQPFTNLANLVTNLPEGAPALLLNGVLSPLTATAAANGYVLENLAAAATTGDAAGFVGALVNAPATITGALLNGFEIDNGDGMPPTFMAGILSPEHGFISGGTISAVLNAFSQIADSLATPGADRDNLFGTLPSLGVAPETVSVNSALAPAAKTVTLDVAKPKEISAAPTASQPVSTAQEPATEEATASPDTDTDAAATDSDAAPAATKLSTKASPKAAKGQSKANAAKAVRDQVKSSVKKLTDGMKKDKVGAEKGAVKKADSAKGADNG
ncbi:hypothetical protein [Mycolicibacterium porcinum]|uniref:PE-PGRS family protein n=1 Tax=Mycolicibacterium porcinum TaxID=39693 RepID=A0AAW5T151_9MYCO|nr:hypothetical protein [Mycolicibacterium porcinum]MBX8692126.1 hypothetical protein [Mycobacterium sp. 20091114027_K0903767]CDO32508.1 PE-PGRS family protein [Mycolicibacterium vulneris]MCV7388451.1 hypothetical protein [Mycolicibacterium porcinum]ORB40688.1 hypothetical protein BST41_13915 [Mycolicibacterium porcinum]TVX96725.1 hypothetical protein FPV58_23980 [Mycolicibacterium porcinum]